MRGAEAVCVARQLFARVGSVLRGAAAFRACRQRFARRGDVLCGAAMFCPARQPLLTRVSSILHGAAALCSVLQRFARGAGISPVSAAFCTARQCSPGAATFRPFRQRVVWRDRAFCAGRQRFVWHGSVRDLAKFCAGRRCFARRGIISRQCFARRGSVRPAQQHFARFGSLLYGVTGRFARDGSVSRGAAAFRLARQRS